MERIETLRKSVDDLSSESRVLRREMRRRTTLLAWLFVGGGVMLACALLAAYTVSLDNQRAIEESNRKWCPMVRIMIPQPGQAHATTARGQEITENARRLYTEFGCDRAK